MPWLHQDGGGLSLRALLSVQPAARSTTSTRWSRSFKAEMPDWEALPTVVDSEGDGQLARQQAFLLTLLADWCDARRSKSTSSSDTLAASPPVFATVVVA